MEAAEKNQQELERLLQGVTEWEAQGRAGFINVIGRVQGERNLKREWTQIHANEGSSVIG